MKPSLCPSGSRAAFMPPTDWVRVTSSPDGHTSLVITLEAYYSTHSKSTHRHVPLLSTGGSLILTQVNQACNLMQSTIFLCVSGICSVRGSFTYSQGWSRILSRKQWRSLRKKLTVHWSSSFIPNTLSAIHRNKNHLLLPYYKQTSSLPLLSLLWLYFKIKRITAMICLPPKSQMQEDVCDVKTPSQQSVITSLSLCTF